MDEVTRKKKVEKGRLLCGLVVAARYGNRLEGFFRKRPEGCVLMIAPCHSIHTFGMKESIHVAFFDRAGVVIRSLVSLPPNRLVSCRRAEGVLERRSSDTEEWLAVGDRLMMDFYSKRNEDDNAVGDGRERIDD